MKDGRTHLAHKAEHAVDVESGAIVAVTVQDASIGDTATIMETLAEAEGQLAQAAPRGARAGHAGGRRGQGLPQRRRAGRPRRGRPARLHLGARAWTAPLARTSHGPASGLREPPSGTQRSRSASTAPAGRARRAVVRSPVRDWANATDASTRPLEHPQAAAGPRGCVQSGSAAARDGRDRNPAEPAELRRPEDAQSIFAVRFASYWVRIRVVRCRAP